MFSLRKKRNTITIELPSEIIVKEPRLATIDNIKYIIIEVDEKKESKNK
jgi:hypothetical protein